MELVDILKSNYSETNFIILSRDLFKDIRPINSTIDIKSQYSQYIENCKFIADFTDEEGKKIAILACRIHDNSKARTIQRNFIAHELTNGELFDYDAAFVAYYDNVNTNWKLSLVTFDIQFDEKISFNFKPAKRYTFSVGPDEPSKTYLKQLGDVYKKNTPPIFDEIKEAFSVIGITNDFYSDYCDCFIKLSDYLMSNPSFLKESIRLGYEEVKEFAITFTKKTLGQIVFLHFIQKKGWLGLDLNSSWGSGNKKFIYNSIKSYNDKNYFNEFLEPLFYLGLNKKRENDIFTYLNYSVKVPFLNGGLFSPIQSYDWQNTNFNIPNDIWFNKKETGFLDILNQYNFTVDESDENEQEIAVDPEMLGRIFESLLDPEERYNKGAHYTPREIVYYMCCETIAVKLSNIIDIPYIDLKNYILYGNTLQHKEYIDLYKNELIKHVKTLKILDPAVGSGAFLVGMLNTMTKLIENLNELLNVFENRYYIKKQVIQKSLYGVDIENDAIDIAKLRLWLSLIVDQETDASKAPKPLPNLLYQLRVGNSLVDTIKGVKLWDKRWKSNSKKKYHDKAVYNLWGVMDSESVEYKIRVAKEKFFTTTDEKEKNSLIVEIGQLQTEMIKDYLLYSNNSDLFYELVDMEKKRTKPFFIWEIEFFSIFEAGGFDIIIANPPYLKERGNSKIFEPVNESSLGQMYHQGKMDYWYYFLHLAMNVINKNSVISFITPRYWLNSSGAKKLINRIKSEMRIFSVLDFENTKVFSSVEGYHMVACYTNNKSVKQMFYRQTTSLNDINLFESNDTFTTALLDNKAIFTKNNEIIFGNVDKKNNNFILLGDICEVSQGVIEASDKISSKMYKKNPDPKHFVGKGIFVLTKEEVDRINLNVTELNTLMKYYDGNSIYNYIINGEPKYIIFADKDLREKISISSEYKNIKKHLDSLADYITSSNKPYGLHRPRKKEYFTVPKIVLPSMFSDNNFSYDESNSVFGMSFNIIFNSMPEYHLKYILAILNSKYALTWFYKNGKHRGAGVDIGVEKLKSFPIAKATDEIKNKLISIVDDIINNGFEQAKQDSIDSIVEELYS